MQWLISPANNYKLLLFLLVVLSVSHIPGAYADNDADPVSKASIEAFDVIDWKVAFERMKKLSQMGYHPFLMPLIMQNKDFIELDKEQILTFRKWRDKNRVPLLHTMNKIISERNKFHNLSLSPDTSEDVLRTKQEEIFKLHKKVLEYQLSCRRNILDTFTEEQWDNFKFVLSENGYEL